MSVCVVIHPVVIKLERLRSHPKILLTLVQIKFQMVEIQRYLQLHRSQQHAKSILLIDFQLPIWIFFRFNLCQVRSSLTWIPYDWLIFSMEINHTCSNIPLVVISSSTLSPRENLFLGSTLCIFSLDYTSPVQHSSKHLYVAFLE